MPLAEEAPTAGQAGVMGYETEKGLPVYAKNGCVYLREVQLESKKRMAIREFLRGCPVEPGSLLGLSS